MFFDKFDLEVTSVDDKPCDPEGHKITFWSSGKVEVTKEGATTEVPKGEIQAIVAAVGAHYQITPEEFASAVEKHKGDHSKEKRA